MCTCVCTCVYVCVCAHVSFYSHMLCYSAFKCRRSRPLWGTHRLPVEDCNVQQRVAGIVSSISRHPTRQQL